MAGVQEPGGVLTPTASTIWSSMAWVGNSGSRIALQVAGARLLGHGAHELAGDRGVAVDHHPGSALLHLGQGFVADGHDDVAADHGVGLACGDARRPELAGVGGDADMRPDRAALLGEAGHVEGGHALALEMGGHAQDGADGDHAGAADAGDQDAPGLGEPGQVGSGQRRQVAGAGQRLALAQRAALDGDEARAEAVDAGIVLVAVGLVDLALGAPFGGDRQDRDAVGLVRAVAAALADHVVDDHAAGRVGETAALAAAALLGGAGLDVDQGRRALGLAQAALDRLQLLARPDPHARRAGRRCSRPRSRRPRPRSAPAPRRRAGPPAGRR